MSDESPTLSSGSPGGGLSRDGIGGVKILVNRQKQA